MTDLNPIIADRFTEHLEVFGKTMEHMDTIQEIAYRCKAALENGNKILFCGNGGSAADSQHLAAELICRFKKERRSLAGIALTTDTSALTAIANDYDFESVFARQVEGLGRTGDVRNFYIWELQECCKSCRNGPFYRHAHHSFHR